MNCFEEVHGGLIFPDFFLFFNHNLMVIDDVAQGVYTLDLVGHLILTCNCRNALVDA